MPRGMIPINKVHELIAQMRSDLNRLRNPLGYQDALGDTECYTRMDAEADQLEADISRVEALLANTEWI